LLAALILGLVFGVALGPCTFAYMAPMLGVTFKLAATHSIYGALLLLAYGVGHCSVIIAAGASTELVASNSASDAGGLAHASSWGRPTAVWDSPVHWGMNWLDVRLDPAFWVPPQQAQN